jgi:hypothetical protein
MQTIVLNSRIFTPIYVSVFVVQHVLYSTIGGTCRIREMGEVANVEKLRGRSYSALYAVSQQSLPCQINIPKMAQINLCEKLQCPPSMRLANSRSRARSTSLKWHKLTYARDCEAGPTPPSMRFANSRSRARSTSLKWRK